MLASAVRLAHQHDVVVPQIELSSTDRVTLNLLRASAAKARTASNLNLFQACQLVSPPSDRALQVYADALFRTLPQAIGQKLTILRVGCREVSFDEAWLLQLLNRIKSNDHDSATFLLQRRVSHVFRRPLLFLLHGVIESLEISAK